MSRVPSKPVETDGTTGETNLQELMEATKERSLLNIESLHPVCGKLIIGDFVRNFEYGVTIRAGFLGCSSTVGWTVVASVVLHEIPHEVADFMALVKGGMNKIW